MVGVILFALTLGNFGQFHKSYHACKEEGFTSKACKVHKKVCQESKQENCGK